MRDLVVSEAGFTFRAAVVSAIVPAAGFLPGFAVVILIGFGIAAMMVASAFRTPENGPL